MTTTAIKHFDALAYVKKAKEFGIKEEFAEFNARQIEQAIDIAISQAKEEIDTKELATKKDIKELELKIAETKNQIILWVAGLFVASGLVQHFFK